MVDKLSGTVAQNMPDFLSGPGQPVEGARAAGAAKAPRSVGQPGATDPGRAGAAQAGSTLKGLVRDLAARPPVDHARVAELRLAMASGSLTPDPGRIADAMIASLGVARAG